MSHFTVLVVLPKETPLEGVNEKLEQVLEPWNENRQVEPYRSYEEGAPEQHWSYDAVCERMLVATPGGEVSPMTWAQYVPLYNQRWDHEDDGDSEKLYVDENTDRAYHMTTYNPLSKWDWWSVGGRWSNSLIAKPHVDLSALLWSPSHWTEQYGNSIPKGRGETGGYHCDAGRLCDIDLEAMQVMAIAKATEEYDDYARIIGDLIGETKPWSHFYEVAQGGGYDEEVARLNASVLDSVNLPDEVLAVVGNRGQSQVFPRDIARREYNHQRGIVRLNEHEPYRHYFGCVVEKFALGRTEYIKRAGANFLPGYAMVTLDGEWLAGGEMGWFGMGSDTEGTVDAFKLEARAYLRDQVDQESILVLVDCHI